jgi:hypothetical protein
VRIRSCILAAVSATLMPANPAVARTTRLQTVDITDRQLSLEGGEARLDRIHEARRSYCRIELIHLGEMGKWVEVFDFGPKLIAAERRRYSYNGHITDPVIQETLTERTTLRSAGGRADLSKAFDEYKTFFRAPLIAKCQGR